MEKNDTGKAKAKKPIYKRWWFIFLVVCFIIGTLNNIFGDKSEEIIGKNIENTLSSAGVKDYTLEKDESLDENGQKGYRAKTDFTKTGIIIHVDKDKKVSSLKFDNIEYVKNGEVTGKITDSVVTGKEQVNYKVSAEGAIKSILKSPSTAKFAPFSEWGFNKVRGVVSVTGYVDSQNSFGAMLRNKFIVEFDAKTEKINHLIFEGKDYIK